MVTVNCFGCCSTRKQILSLVLLITSWGAVCGGCLSDPTIVLRYDSLITLFVGPPSIFVGLYDVPY